MNAFGRFSSLAMALALGAAVMQPVDAMQRRAKKRKPKAPIVGCTGVFCSGISSVATQVDLGGRLELLANATDPDGDVLHYKWDATIGTIEGTGANVVYLAPTDKAGKATVTVTVDDGYGHWMDCSITLQVGPALETP